MAGLFDEDLLAEIRAADLYGATLRVHLTERIRPEMKFSGVDELVTRIRADIDTARRATASETPDPAAQGAWY